MYVFNPSVNHCIINYDTGGTSRSTWIEACQRARVDPHHLISQRTDELIQLVLEKVDMTKNVCRTFCVSILNFYMFLVGFICGRRLSGCHNFNLCRPGFGFTTTDGSAKS